MPAPINLTQKIRNHIQKHRISQETALAVFVIYPDSIAAHEHALGAWLRLSVDLHRNHYPRRMHERKIFVNTWKLPGSLLTEALRNLHRHAARRIWNNLDIMVVIHCHMTPDYFLDFGGYLVSRNAVVHACDQLPHLSGLLLLGCYSGGGRIAQSKDFPVIGFIGEVDYDDLPRLTVGFLNHFQFCRLRRIAVNPAIDIALDASCTQWIPRNKVTIK